MDNLQSAYNRSVIKAVFKVFIQEIKLLITFTIILCNKRNYSTIQRDKKRLRMNYRHLFL